MKPVTVSGPWPKLQRHWDIRAAGNFIGGGTGSGLILAAAVAAATGRGFAPALLAGLVCVGLGLTMVLLEIGRPWRALNVFFHPRTSWMTREGVLALPLFACGGLALLLDWAGAPVAPAMAVVAGVLAVAFLYCQARILGAAKGIPAWREPALLPFLMASGLTEGAGLLAILAQFGLAPAWATPLGLGLLVVRLVLWRGYLSALARNGAPAASLAALSRLAPGFIGLNGLAVLLFATAILLPAASAAAGLAGGLAAIAGWLAKLTIVTKAAATRGFALPRTPVRGQGTSRLLGAPGWQMR